MNDTHQVLNQVPPLEDYDAYTSNVWLAAAMARAGVGWVTDAAVTLGRFVGSAEAQQHAADANRFTPQLRSHDRSGRRIDAVDYHPSYHALMTRALESGLHSLAWKREPGGFSARAALNYLWNELEQGTSCPVTMTFASIPVFEHAPALQREWRDKVLADHYDPRPLPLARKSGVTVGMAMTEKQGGSDLRAVQTAAVPDGGHHRLTGHKWFCSAPMSDGFFTLARLAEGVTCFFVPRSLADGTRNVFRIQRLKDKVGNRSNASSEIEYEDTAAWIVGEPGRGIPTLIEMAHHTRFDIVVAVAGMMRAALDHALHHARHRSAFGRALVDQPLMARVLADLALEAEAAALLAFRLAQSFDAARAGDKREASLQRALTPVAKYWVSKRMPAVALEAMECLGGNGYVEESPLARLYREAPLNGIWEGSANVICLDALRAFAKSPEAFDALAAQIDDKALVDRVRALLKDEAAEANARSIVETLAVAIQAALMDRYADRVAADAFRARLTGWGRSGAFGNVASDADAAAILKRLSPLRAA